ncbi:MAG: YbaB/EbfC family nucleoid-associated protein [Asticcacaulis sp.]
MDFQQLMKQAQQVQQKFSEAQARMHESVVSGQAGAGLVQIEIKGTGEMLSIKIDDSLLSPGESEVLSDLILAAHSDAHKKLEELNQKLIAEAAGPLGANGGLPNMPRFF